MAVASFCYFQIGIMVGCGEVALAVACGYFGFAQVGEELLVVEFAIEFVHLRNLLLEFFAIALREASHDIELIETAFSLSFSKFKYRIDTLFFSVFDETTGIDDCNLTFRVLGIVDATVSVGFELPHEKFGVDQILGAPHGDEVYLVLFHSL